MARGTENTYRFCCPNCGALTTAKCRQCGAVDVLDPIGVPGDRWLIKPFHFTERQWEVLVARAKATPGVKSPSELVRLAIQRVLSRPLHRLRRPIKPTEGR